MKANTSVCIGIRWSSALLFCFFAAVYLLYPTPLSGQHYDSLSYAWFTETAGMRAMQGNHPLGHFIGNSTYAAARSLGYGGRALTVFQAINAVAGALTIAVFHLLLSCRLRVRRWCAFGAAVLFGSGFSFWQQAGTGDIYIIAGLFLIAAWWYLTAPAEGGRPSLAAGIAAGLAIASHQLGAAVLPAGALVLMLRGSDIGPRLRHASVFLVSAVVSAGCCYGLLGLLATGSPSPRAIIAWMGGYLAAGNSGYGQHFHVASIPVALDTLSATLLISPGPGRALLFRNGLFLALLAVVAWGTGLSWKRRPELRPVISAFALHCLLSWCAILWWEPYNPKFYLFSLMPWWAAVAVAFDAVHGRLSVARAGALRIAAPAFFISALCLASVLNIHYGKLREHRTAARFDEAIAPWLAHSAPGDVLITAGDLVQQLAFWAGRPGTVHLCRTLRQNTDPADPLSSLKDIIRNAQTENREVLLDPAACVWVSDAQLADLNLTRRKLCDFFNGLPMIRSFEYSNLITGHRDTVFKLEPGAVR